MTSNVWGRTVVGPAVGCARAAVAGMALALVSVAAMPVQAAAPTKAADAVKPAEAAVTERATRSALLPHRAVYDLSLLESRGAQAVAAVSGRIAFDFSGDACTGYNLDFRQISVVEQAEGEPNVVDARSATFEAADGSSFSFRQTVSGGEDDEQIQGEARQSPGPDGKPGIAIDLRAPEPRRIARDGEILFPTAHLKRLLAAAQAGESTLDIKMFDGAETGDRVFDTFAVIGKKVAPGPDRPIEAAAQAGGLDKVDRWPVTLSFFEPGAGERTPVYSLSYDLYANGVSAALKLNYGDFVVRGTMVQLQPHGDGACLDKANKR